MTDNTHNGERVEIPTMNGMVGGTVLRIWGQNVANVTVKTDAGATFVRLARDVKFIDCQHGYAETA
jgi:hypothetical protein